ncbi:hypothetical protein CASFOL_015343 [Castilleja foliolosa]|uniref:BHLH domain-containing protein n=1 Tax=Castilleja foliolosa TaxID=1961234 RepID=A0ABD3DHN8_9LAMI
MDSSAISWLSEMELDDSVFGDQCDFLDEEVAAVIQQDLESCLSSFDQNNLLGSDQQPAKLQKPNSDFTTFPGPDNAPIILNFGDANSTELSPEEEARVASEEQYSKQAKKTRRARPASQTYDHIIAERKRREQLSQRFVILSTIVPGLKKMDKTSVLGDAINYLKQLQERVKTLEEQASKKTMESVVLVKKLQIVEEEEEEDESSGRSSEHPLPEVEARVCNNRLLLIRVHCEKKRGLLANLLAKIESLNLVIANTNVVTFAGSVLDITIIAQMEEKFKLTTKEVVKRIRTALHVDNKS